MKDRRRLWEIGEIAAEWNLDPASLIGLRTADWRAWQFRRACYYWRREVKERLAQRKDKLAPKPPKNRPHTIQVPRYTLEEALGFGIKTGPARDVRAMLNLDDQGDEREPFASDEMDPEVEDGRIAGEDLEEPGGWSDAELVAMGVLRPDEAGVGRDDPEEWYEGDLPPL